MAGEETSLDSLFFTMSDESVLDFTLKGTDANHTHAHIHTHTVHECNDKLIDSHMHIHARSMDALAMSPYNFAELPFICLGQTMLTINMHTARCKKPYASFLIASESFTNMAMKDPSIGLNQISILH